MRVLTRLSQGLSLLHREDGYGRCIRLIENAEKIR